MDLKFRVQAKIQKPVSEVFDAVYDPKKLSSYFTTGGASGPLKEGLTVTWNFADDIGHLGPGGFPVEVKKVIQNELVILEWRAESDNYNTRVEMKFESLGRDSTLVTITESGWRETQKGLESSYGNCQGWMQMSCCLKAYLEYGINLRRGFF